MQHESIETNCCSKVSRVCDQKGENDNPAISTKTQPLSFMSN